jgi:glycerol-3-phosphate acyltransferase PlsY
MAVVLVCSLAFLLGAVPFALLVVRVCKGVDVRTVGSGNVGATNASRAFASKGGRLGAFLAIYLLDAAKGFAPAWFGPGFAAAHDAQLVAVLAGACAVLGHVFTPFLGFRGGKGVATATGVLLALDWQVTLISLGVFFVVRAATGHVFFGSIALGLRLAGRAAIGCTRRGVRGAAAADGAVPRAGGLPAVDAPQQPAEALRGARRWASHEGRDPRQRRLRHGDGVVAGARRPRVALWGHDAVYTAHIAASRQNPRYLDGVVLPERIRVTNDAASALDRQ